MLKPFTKSLPLLVNGLLLSLLIGCASSPDTPDSAAPVSVPVDVDASTNTAYQRAVNAMKNGRDDLAISQFSAITQTHPNLAGPFINLGLIHLKKGEFEKAEKHLVQATTLKPTDAVAQTHLGIAYRQLGKFKQAESAYTEALQSNPKYPFAHLNAGILYDIYLNDLTRALNHYQQYQALTGDSDELVKKWIIDLERRAKNQS